LGVKTPPKLFAIFVVSQLCLFVQQNIFRLRLLDIGVGLCLNYLLCHFMLDLIYINSKSQSSIIIIIKKVKIIVTLSIKNTAGALCNQCTYHAALTYLILICVVCIWLVTVCGITWNGKKIPNRNPCRHAQKLTILKKMQKFSGEGDTPYPDPTPLGASIFAPTALKLNVTRPEKNPSYGLAGTIFS